MSSTRHPATIVLLTESFPFGVGEPFLEEEVQHLAAAFEQLVIVPADASGNMRRVPEGVEVDPSVGSRPRATPLRLAAGLPRLPFESAWLSELSSRPGRVVNPRHVGRILNVLDRAARFRAHLSSAAFARRLSGPRVIYYSYWFTGTALAAAEMRRRGGPVRALSRAHGYDVYEERSRHRYLPFWDYMLEHLDCVCCVSEDARQRMVRRHPESAEKVEVRRLGVVDPRAAARTSADGMLNLLSCSFLVPVKRIDLLIDAIAALVQLSPQARIRWTHIGDGPLREGLEAHARARLEGRAQWRFLGNLPNSAVLDYYAAEPVDVFLNTSQSEGVPVSIMEAHSYGVPVVAPRVGGIEEIVDESNGRLLDPETPAADIAAAIASVAGPGHHTLRDGALSSWRNRYSARRNYREFVEYLSTLANRAADE